MKKLLVGLLMMFFIASAVPALSEEEGFNSQTQCGWILEDEIKVFEKQAVIWIINHINDGRRIEQKIVFDETKPLPEVFTERQITVLDFIDIMSEMTPGHDRTYIRFITPMFVYHKNQIIVSGYSYLHSLVHELVHYVQKEYKGASFDDAANDPYFFLEGEAINIQRKWEKLYVEGLDDSWFKYND